MSFSTFNTIHLRNKSSKCSNRLSNQLSTNNINKLITSISENINFVSYAKASCFLLDELNRKYDNVIDKAIKLFINPLEKGKYNLIPTSASVYFNIVNPLTTIISEDPNLECSLHNIINAVKASRMVRTMYDNTSNFKEEILQLKKQIEQLKLNGGDVIDVFGGECNSSGHLSLSSVLNFTPLMAKYIETYGFPKKGIGIDSVKLYEIKEIMILQGLDPYKYPDLTECNPIPDYN